MSKVAEANRILTVPIPFFLLSNGFFQGIAIVSFFFEKKQFPRPMRIILYVMIAAQQILLLVVIGVGFFDMWINFRKLEKQKSV